MRSSLKYYNPRTFPPSGRRTQPSATIAGAASSYPDVRLPLLYVGTPICYFAMAGPLGMLADRVGRPRMFIAGHAGLLLVYALLAFAPAGPLLLVGALLLLGAYYAATDGVLAAMASAALPAHLRATGLSVLATGTTLARAGAAVAFGALWTFRGSEVALGTFAVGLLLAIAAGGVLLTRAGQSRPLDSPGGLA